MKRFLWLLGQSSILLLNISCGDNQDAAGAAALYSRIQTENYRSWARAPGYETRRPSNTAHADAVDVYVNDVTAQALAQKAPLTTWPEGSLIVKDGFDNNKLELVAVMEKRADGWYWAEYFGEEAKYSGKPDICIDCHKSGADFVRSFPFPSP